MHNLEIMTFRYLLQTLDLWLVDFEPHTYPLINFRKIDMTTKKFGDFIMFPPIFQGTGGGGGWVGGVMPWFHLVCMAPQRHISHPPLDDRLFWESPISTRVVQEPNLNQIDGWVSILWEHLNYIQQEKRTLSGTWGWVKKKVTLASGTSHGRKFVECLP